MGILSSIGKGLKGLFKGVGKVFKKVFGEVGKLLNSNLGKVLMAAVSVFTLGSAFIAAQSAYAAAATVPNSSFIGSFLKGGQAFVETLVGKKATAEAAGEGVTTGAQAAANTAAGAAPQAQGMLSGIDPTAAATDIAGNVAGGSLEMGGAIQGIGGSGSGSFTMPAATGPGAGANALEGIGGLLSKGTEALKPAGDMLKTAQGAAAAGGTDAGGWLSKAASAAMDFAKSDAGQNIIGGALKGWQRDDELDRYEKIAMRGPNSFRPGARGMKALGDVNYDIDVPNNLAYDRGAKAGKVASGYQARVPYQQRQGG